MCSIIMSPDKQLLRDLVQFNQEKGTFSNSLTLMRNGKVSLITKKFGLFADTNDKFVDDNGVVHDNHIVHLQAPTGGMVKDITRMHPACSCGMYLYHNGLLKNSCIAELMKKMDTKIDFDTQLMLMYINSVGLEEALNYFDGSYACILSTPDGLRIFRSKHSKLYTDMKGSFSSEKYNDDWKCINADTIYDEKLNILGTFKTKSFNVVIAGEL